jgi:hypothetical protein
MEQGRFKGDANNKTYAHKILSFVNYQVVIAESAIFLQIYVHKLGNVTSNYVGSNPTGGMDICLL